MSNHKQTTKDAKASALDQSYEADRNRRLGVDKLTIERNARPTYDTPSSKPAAPNIHEQNFKDKIKQKYKMASLHLEGQHHDEASKVEAAMIQSARDILGSKTLSCGSVQYKGESTRLWYEIKI